MLIVEICRKIKMEDINIAKSSLIEQAFDFWFGNHDHIRSPFPDYILNELKLNSTSKFESWINNLRDGAKDELNEEMIAEKFEEIMFETAHKLVVTEDEKTTILYPFLPRLGDKLKDAEENESEITDRNILKENDTDFLKITCRRLSNNEIWSTSFELPT